MTHEIREEGSIPLPGLLAIAAAAVAGQSTVTEIAEWVRICPMRC